MNSTRLSCLISKLVLLHVEGMWTRCESFVKDSSNESAARHRTQSIQTKTRGVDGFTISGCGNSTNQGPPAFLPDGFVEHEVQEVLSHQDDADNERWYQVKWESQDITWEPEMHMANCRDKISDYFLRIGKPNDRPSRLSKRGRPSKKTRPESHVAIPSDDITLQLKKIELAS